MPPPQRAPRRTAMPLYSDHISNMYYSGSSSYSAPYSYSSKTPIGSSYSASYLNPGSSYSNHSSLGGYSRTPVSSRWIASSGRTYSPILSTISERTTSSPSRITSPRRIPSYKRRYVPSSYTPRPININTADIDVSRNKYRTKTESPPPPPPEADDPNADNENGPFMPRIDGKPETGIDSSPGELRSTIKRGRTVVRLHTIKRKDRDSPRKPQDESQKSGSEERDKNESVEENAENKNAAESMKWREKLSEDLIYKDKRQKKTIGAKLMEKFIVKDNDSDSEIITDNKTKQDPVTALCAPPTPQPSSSKSPTRRCSMEILAEQANLLDSLIRSENLSDATLDLRKIGIEELVDGSQGNNKSIPLKTTKSDNSLHDRFRKSRESIEPKHSMKRRSLKKSSSGGRLDSITEFPKEATCSILPSIEENRSSIKNDNQSKPKQKLRAKITGTVEVSPPTSPLKFKVEDVTVEEKPRVLRKEISYSSTVGDNFDDSPKPANRSITNALRKSRMRSSIRKKSDLESNVPSPEPDDGNFWDKIGKRETVYLLKRKQDIEDAKEKHRRAIFWFPEDEGSANEDIFEKVGEVNPQNNDEVIVPMALENDARQHEKNEALSSINNDKLSVSDTPNNMLPINSETKNNITDDSIDVLNKVEVSPIIFTEVTDGVPLLQDVIKYSKSNSNLIGTVDNQETPKTGNENNKINNDTTNSDSSIDTTCLPDFAKKYAISTDSNKPQQRQINNNKSLSKTEDEITTVENDTIPNLPNTPLGSRISNNETKRHLEKSSSDSFNLLLKKPKDEDLIPPISKDVTVDKVLPKPKTEDKPSVNTVQDKSIPKKQVTPKETKVQEKTCPVHAKKDNSFPQLDAKAESLKTEKQECLNNPKTEETPCPVHAKKQNNPEQIEIKPESLKHIKQQSSLAVKIEEEPCPVHSKNNNIDLHTNKKEESAKPPIVTEISLARNVDVGSSVSSELRTETLKKEVTKVDDKVVQGTAPEEKSLADVSQLPVIIELEHIPKDETAVKNEDENTRETNKAENKSLNKENEPATEVIKPVIKKPVKEELAVRPLIATPRPLQKKSPQVIHSGSSSSSSSEEDSSEDDDADESDTSEESAEFFECENNADGRTSTGSNDSGFDSSAPTSPAGFLHIKKDCDVNCHRKCEKLTANLCGVNQRLLVEALSSKSASKKGGESPGTSAAAAAAPNIPDFHEQELEQSTAYGLFRKTGRFTPPARSIPRFRKYTIDDFHFVKVLGKGSFGKIKGLPSLEKDSIKTTPRKRKLEKVLLAELRDTEYYYAVKCLKKDVVLEDDDVECTLIERRVLALGTNHPYLCHLFATFQTDSHLFFVMEYLNGGDLMFHIQQSGRFPESRARFYAAEIVSGLKFLHKRGIVYRDLKLDNILLDFDGHVRIADFGMCKLQIYLEKTADTFCGTPDYMAPEIIKGLKYNQTVDWWSFGVLLYEMLIGQSPFSGCDEDELFWSICNEMPSYPRFLSTDSLNILTRLLDKDARTRLGGIECMHGDIRDQEFFHQIHWDRLERRELEAPFKPKVRHPLDTQYFDRAFTGERPRLTAVEPHVLRSMDQQPFRGFSYTNPNATDR